MQNMWRGRLFTILHLTCVYPIDNKKRVVYIAHILARKEGALSFRQELDIYSTNNGRINYNI